MSIEENKAVISRLLREGLAKQDRAELIVELIVAPHVRAEWDASLRRSQI